jgi:hypothetical protein
MHISWPINVRKYLDHYCVTKGHGAKSQVYKPDSQGSKEVTLVDWGTDSLSQHSVLLSRRVEEDCSGEQVSAVPLNA